MSTINRGKSPRFLDMFSATLLQEFMHGIYCGKIDFRTLGKKEREQSNPKMTEDLKNKILLEEFGTIEEYFHKINESKS